MPEDTEVKGKKSPIFILMIVGIFIVGVASGLVATNRLRASEKPKIVEVAKPALVPEYIKLKPEFTVNLRSNSQYLETEIVLKIDDKKAEPELKEKMNEIRDKVIAILASETYNNLLTQSGKDGLKLKIKTAVNSQIKKGKIIEVYFTSFIMQ